MLISYFHIFQRGFEVLNTIIQISVYATIATAIVYLQYVPISERSLKFY